MCCRYETISSSDPFTLSEDQFDLVSEWFPRAHGRARVDDRSVLSGIIHVLKTGIMWRDLPAGYGVRWRTVYNRFVRWSAAGVLDGIFCSLFSGDRLLVSADDILAHRSGEVWAERGFFPGVMSIV